MHEERQTHERSISVAKDFALEIYGSGEPVSRGRVEQSPLYVQKEFVGLVDPNDEWEVSRSRVHLGALIGSGAFGRVHAAQLEMPGGETITSIFDDASEEEMQDFLGEIVMLKHVGSHKHVIRLIACCTTQAPLIALLEHAPRGDLLTLLRTTRGRRKVEQTSCDTRTFNSDANGRPSEADTLLMHAPRGNLLTLLLTARGRRKVEQPSCETRMFNSDRQGRKNMEQTSCETRMFNSDATGRPSEAALLIALLEYAPQGDLLTLLHTARGRRKVEQTSCETRMFNSGANGRPSEADSVYTNLSDSDPALSESKLCADGSDRLKTNDHYVAEPALQLDSTTMREDLAARNILVDGAGVLKVADFGLSRSGVYVHTRSRPLSNSQVPTFLSGGGRLPKPARASQRLYELMVDCWSEDPTRRPSFTHIVDKLTAQRQLYVDLDSIFMVEEPFDDDESQWSKD
ncbi:unnamed protein product [Chilo suppressalis]|uniref:Protein kinase domain-containing protein n=1 Tax=Chilo suppressalis TaxID=168631 RepID=A0ABN8ATY0_CHISP|nr:unnamed protein product [Chilo suppressalis]